MLLLICFALFIVSIPEPSQSDVIIRNVHGSKHKTVMSNDVSFCVFKMYAVNEPFCGFLVTESNKSVMQFL